MLRLKNNIYLSKKEPQSRKASTGVSKLSFLFQAIIHIDFKNELSWTSRLISSPEKVQVSCLSNQVLFSIFPFSFWAPKGLFQLEWNGKTILKGLKSRGQTRWKVCSWSETAHVALRIHGCACIVTFTKVALQYSAIFLNFLFVIRRRHDANDLHGL